MSNFSQLYTIDGEGPNLTAGDRRPSRVRKIAKYHLPLLWLSLFDASCMRRYPLSEEDAPWPYLVSHVDAAVEMLQSRVSLLTAIFSFDVGILANNLGEDLFEGGQAFVILDTHDTGSMVADGAEWTSEVETMMRAFCEPFPRLVQETTGTLRLADKEAGTGWKCYLNRFPLNGQMQYELAEYLAGPEP
jgi:hypothetical protein